MAIPSIKICDYPLSSNLNNRVSQDIINKYTSGYNLSTTGSVSNGCFTGTAFNIYLTTSTYNQNYNLMTYPWTIEFDARWTSVSQNTNRIFAILNNDTVKFGMSYKNLPTTYTSSYFNQTNWEVLNKWRTYTIVYHDDYVSLYIDGEEKFTIRGFTFPKYRSNQNSSCISLGNGNNNTFQLRNFTYIDGYKREFNPITLNNEFPCGCIVRKAVMNVPLDITIPFPYKQFTDTEFFLTNTVDKLFIPQKYYSRSDEYTIHFSPDNVAKLNITTDDEIRFTFAHNQGLYHVHKQEYTFVLKKNVYEYRIPHVPFGYISDLDVRYKVFYNRKFIHPYRHYKFNLWNGLLIVLNDDFQFNEGDELSILLFYVGNHKLNNTITDLPMSGYINLKRNEIDRNYTNDLMVVYVNGKLVPQEYITQMSNSLFKVSKDIQSRYNLEVRSLSPRVNELVPYFKTHANIPDIPTQYQYQEFPCYCFISGYENPHGRYILDADLDPITIHDLLMTHKDWYISLLHHGVKEYAKDSYMRYTLNFYRDDYYPEPEEVRVIGQIRGIHDDHDFVEDSPTALLIGKLSPSMGQVLNDQVLMSVKINDIYNADTSNHNQDVSGILCRLVNIKNDFNDPHPVYYTLETSSYELNNYDYILEWVISTKANGKGEVIYRKTINCFPYNDPYANA